MTSRAVCAALLLTVLSAAACGTGTAAPGQANLANGKTLFQHNCGVCHTMVESNSIGKVGPNLDWAYVGDRLQGMDSSSFEALVREQIGSPGPRGVMPANIVKGSDAQDVAAYVASVAGIKLAAQERTQNNLTTQP